MTNIKVIVHAEAFGASQEHELLKPMIEGIKEKFEELGDKDVFGKAKLVADNGYHTESNMKIVIEEGIDPYILIFNNLWLQSHINTGFSKFNCHYTCFFIRFCQSAYYLNLQGF